MRFLGIAGAVPRAYSEEQTAEAGRELQRQKALMQAAEMATMQRQAPLQDALLRAQIAHLQRPPQSQIEGGGNEALLRFLAQQGQTQPMPQPPSSVGPQAPMAFQDPSRVQVTPQQGSVGATLPPMPPASLPGPMPTGGGQLPLMPLPQNLQQPQSGPLQGASPTPQQPQTQQPQGPLSPQQQYERILRYSQSIPDPMKRQAFIGQALMYVQQQQQEQQKAIQIARQQQQAAETERHHGVMEQHSEARQNVAMFDAQAARIRGDITMSPEEKEAAITALGQKLGIPQYQTSTIPDQDKTALQAMMRSKMGIGPNEPLDPEAAQRAGVFGQTYKLPSGKKYILYRDEDGSTHYEVVK